MEALLLGLAKHQLGYRTKTKVPSVPQQFYGPPPLQTLMDPQVGQALDKCRVRKLALRLFVSRQRLDTQPARVLDPPVVSHALQIEQVIPTDPSLHLRAGRGKMRGGQRAEDKVWDTRGSRCVLKGLLGLRGRTLIQHLSRDQETAFQLLEHPRRTTKHLRMTFEAQGG